MMASFPQFKSLPTEIRHMVWVLSLLHILDKPGFTVFGLSYQTPFNLANDENLSTLALDVRARVRLPTPAALFVCHEASDVALSWLTKNEEVEKRVRKVSGDGVFSLIWARVYKPNIDSVYIPPHQWELMSSAMEESHMPMHAPIVASITHLALPAFNAYYSIEKLSWWLGQMPNLERISVLWDELPEPIPDRMQVHERWEYEEIDEDEDVRLCHTDPETGQATYEIGSLEDYRQDIDEQWSTCEDLLDQFVDVELGEARVPYVHVRAKKALLDWV